MKEGSDMLREKGMNRFKTLGDCDDSINEVSSMFEILQQPFQNLKSEHLRLKQLEISGNLIHAEDYIVGDRYQKTLPEEGHVRMKPTAINAKFFPLREIFKKVFDTPGVYDAVMDYKSKFENKSEVLSTFFQKLL